MIALSLESLQKILDLVGGTARAAEVVKKADADYDAVQRILADRDREMAQHANTMQGIDQRLRSVRNQCDHIIRSRSADGAESCDICKLVMAD